MKQKEIREYNYPSIKQVGEIIDILFPLWEHFGNKESLVTHHGSYDKNGERHATSIYDIDFVKCTDATTTIKIRFWLSGIQIWEIKKGIFRLQTNTNQFELYKYLIKNNILR